MRKREPDYPNIAFPYDLGKGCPYCGSDDFLYGEDTGIGLAHHCKGCGSVWNLNLFTGTAVEIEPPGKVVQEFDPEEFQEKVEELKESVEEAEKEMKRAGREMRRLGNILQQIDLEQIRDEET